MALALGSDFERESEDFEPKTKSYISKVQSQIGASARQNQRWGQQMAKSYGWTDKEWDALNELWIRESGWKSDAANPTSSARGIPQAIMSLHFGGSGWSKNSTAINYMSNPLVQIKWGLDYIKRRYGTPSRALKHWKSRAKINGKDVGHWY